MPSNCFLVSSTTSTSIHPIWRCAVYLPSIGIVKRRAFLRPDAPTRDLLDKAVRTASRMSHAIAYQPSAMVPNGLYYANRCWINPSPGNATFTADRL